MDTFENTLYRALCLILGLLIFAMTILIFTQVVCRYLFDNSLTWSEEVGRYLFIWITFLGLPAALKAKAHVALDLLVKKSRGTFKQALLLINAVLTLIFAVVVAVSGFKLILLGIGQHSSALMLPIWALVLSCS